MQYEKDLRFDLTFFLLYYIRIFSKSLRVYFNFSDSSFSYVVMYALIVALSQKR